ncbi:MAG: hypothetical protein K0Q97_2042 [Bacillota bacterium]|nr:hypothetical protein [Bacillota bacterium]
MKNKNLFITILLALGVVILTISLKMLDSAANRWIPGLLILISVIVIGGSAKLFSEEYILKKYKNSKIEKNIKTDVSLDNQVKQKASSKANFIVSLLLVIVLILIFFIKINYIILTIVIVASIYIQSCLNAFLYIHYDKKIKTKQ